MHKEGYADSGKSAIILTPNQYAIVMGIYKLKAFPGGPVRWFFKVKLFATLDDDPYLPLVRIKETDTIDWCSAGRVQHRHVLFKPDTREGAEAGTCFVVHLDD